MTVDIKLSTLIMDLIMSYIPSPVHAYGIGIGIFTAIISMIAMTSDIKFVMYFGAHHISLASFLSSLIMIKGILEVSCVMKCMIFIENNFLNLGEACCLPSMDMCSNTWLFTTTDYNRYHWKLQNLLFIFFVRSGIYFLDYHTTHAFDIAVFNIQEI